MAGGPKADYGVAAPQGLAVVLALLRRQKDSLHLWFVTWEGNVTAGTPWAGWWLFVEHSEIPMWKELMKD